MKKIYLALVYILVSVAVFSQQRDTIKLRKVFLQINALEKSFPDSSIKLYESLIEQEKSNPNQKVIGMSYHRLAELIYDQKKDLNKYFELCYKAIKIFEVIQDSTNAINIYQNLGVNLVRQNRFTEGLVYYKAVADYAARHRITSLIIRSNMAMAECYSSSDRSDTAILILKNLADNYPKDGKQDDYGMLLNNIGNTYYNLADQSKNNTYFLNAIEYAKKARDLFLTLTNESENLAYSYGLLGAAYMAADNYSESEKNYGLAIKFFHDKNRFGDLELMYYELTQLNIKQGKADKASHYLALYDSLSKQLFSNENSNSISAMKTQFETDKKENENKLLQKENNQQKIISYFIIGGLVLAISFAFFIFRGLKNQRRANKIISKQKEEVHHQKEIVEEKQKEILDSIHYAKRIQRAVITSDAYIAQYLKDYFIFYQPKDIVSGDFYWALHTNTGFYLATADCTGHGVPGAFMSLLNISILNEVLIEKKIVRPDLILNEARKDIIRSLNPTGSEESKDGMDCILACFNFEKLTLEYAAANNSFYIVRDNKLMTCKADKMPVGKSPRDTEPFTLHTIDLQKGDIVYMLTDGLPDQFGGEKGKKFKYKQLEDLLVNNTEKPLQEQRYILERSFNEWKGNLEQVDDVLLIGIKI